MKTATFKIFIKDVVTGLKSTIKSSRAVGCEEDRKTISKSELKKDRNVSAQTVLSHIHIYIYIYIYVYIFRFVFLFIFFFLFRQHRQNTNQPIITLVHSSLMKHIKHDHNRTC